MSFARMAKNSRDGPPASTPSSPANVMCKRPGLIVERLESNELMRDPKLDSAIRI